MNTFSQEDDKITYNNIPDTEENESYIEQYEEENGIEENEVMENEEENLDTSFSEALDRDTFENEDLESEDAYPEEKLEEDEEDLDENDLDDDLVEDYDENDREIESKLTDKLKTKNSDLIDIDQDLEEVDPVNHPREFDY